MKRTTMKRTALVLLILLLGCLQLSAGTGNLWIRLSGSRTFYTGELWGYIPSSDLESGAGGGTGFGLRVALEFFQGITIGLSFSHLQIKEAIVHTGYFDIPLTAQAMPIMLSYQQFSGPLFMLAEAGICAWNGDKGGMDKTLAFGGGYIIPLNSWLTFDATLRFLLIFSDELITPLTLSVGISCML